MNTINYETGEVSPRFHIRGPQSFKKADIQPEVNNLPSMTIPDQSFSVQYIMDRYTRGLPIPNLNYPMDAYEAEGNDPDPEFYPDPQHMDLADRAQLADEMEQQLQIIQTREADRKTKSAEKHLKRSDSDAQDATERLHNKSKSEKTPPEDSEQTEFQLFKEFKKSKQ